MRYYGSYISIYVVVVVVVCLNCLNLLAASITLFQRRETVY